MNATMDKVIADVTQDTLTNLAFLLPMDDGGQAAPEGGAESVVDPVTVTVGFDGPRTGSVRLTVARRMMTPLAINMLGLESDQTPTPEQQLDATREMANVVCGNLLPAVENPQSVFNVLPPVVWQDQVAPTDSAPAAKALLRLEDGEMLVELFMQ